MKYQKLFKTYFKWITVHVLVCKPNCHLDIKSTYCVRWRLRWRWRRPARDPPALRSSRKEDQEVDECDDRDEVARRAAKEDIINFLEQIDAEKDKGVDPLPLCAGPSGSCNDAGCAVS